MQFIPNNDQKPTIDVPYFDEARSADGWQGHTTTLSYDRLKSDVTNAIARLGGVVHSFQQGTYEIEKKVRMGVQIHYSIEGPNKQMIYGRLDIAALPVKEPKRRSNWRGTKTNWEEASLRMAMFNVVQVLKAQWILKQMNPDYVPLMPWLLNDKGRTITELYTSAGMGNLALPKPKTDEAIMGEFREMDN